MATPLKPRVYLSFDIEADGPTPRINSMIQFGVVAVLADGREIQSWCVNIKPEEGAVQDPATMTGFWATNPQAWMATQTNQVSSHRFQATLVGFLDKLSSDGYHIVWCAYPAAFDWQWLKDVYQAYKEPNDPDIGYSAKCISTLLWAYEKANKVQDKDGLKKELAGELTLTHNAEEDARYQAKLFLGLCKRMGIEL